MEKEEILAKAQKENQGVDLVDKQAQREGAWIAYFVAVLAIIVVDLVNGFVLNNVNRGADFALFSMAFTAFLIKYIKLRKTHELFVTIFQGIGAIGMLVWWILQLCGVAAQYG